MLYIGEETGSGGVGIPIKKFNETSDRRKELFQRNTILELVGNEGIVSVIYMYGLQCGRSDKGKSAFYDELNAVVGAKNEKCFVVGNFNKHVGSLTDGYVGV